LDGMLCKHHFSKNGQVFFHIFWVVTLIMQSRRHFKIWRKNQKKLRRSHKVEKSFQFMRPLV
ncbi:hypothetical protein EFP53_06755, partial [Lacticaseibacillus paracasei]|nr:hypothetical protein [Lacticaseibacillus paracasei]